MTDRLEIQRFTFPEETGIVDGTTFRYADRVHDVMLHESFTLCPLEGSRIALFFVEYPLATGRRAEIAAARPEWVDAVVFAEVDPMSRESRALVDVQIPVRGNATANAIGFAAALVIAGHGAFDFVPTAYLVRFPDGTAVEVTLSFDSDTESWDAVATTAASSAR